MAEVDLTLSIPVPKAPTSPPTSPVGGVAWNPTAQLQLFRVVGPTYITAGVLCVEKMLGLNPSRVMWSAQLITLSGLPSYRPGSFDGLSGNFVNVNTFGQGLPVRCQSAEWPGLCQGEWTAYFTNAGDIIEVYEVVSIY